MTETVTLREISAETVRTILRLKVADHQREFVAPNAWSIAEAHFEPKAWMRAIYADETPVGFMMTFEDPSKGTYYLWRYMIDGDHQGKGYGRAALEQLIGRIKQQPNAAEIKLGVVQKEGSAAAFYEKLGFIDTGEVEWGEAVYKLTF